ncbi:MAG: TRAP transporter large permease [Cyclobacteriaceae bacterium]|nr:TRAP transporter large permease [Cyclobacteriaceae bacterium HetDA_MAG_MS6]
MDVLILVITFLLLLSIGVPIAYSIGLSAVITLAANMDPLTAFTTVAQRMATGLDSFSLLAIPFFVLAGQLMNRGGIASKLINFARSLIGVFPGGLAYVNILSCMLFGAISGSAVAAASAIGGFMVPRMSKEGYPKPFSAAVNLTSSTTGLVIPPSNILIVYSLASGGASVAALFLAGYIPGILMGLALIVVSAVYAYRNKLPTAGRSSIPEIVKYFLDALPSLMLLVIVMGGIVAGIFTATEASAIAVVYTFVLAVFIYKEIKLSDMSSVLLESVKTTTVVLFLVATSMSMSWVMSFENIPQEVSAALLSLSDNKIVILLIINLILLFVGVFMDMTPAVLIFTPIFLPVVGDLGIDPVHFGIIMVMNLCIGLCTPPVGSILFVGVSVAGVKIQEVLRPLMPLFLVLIIVLLLVTYIPGISMLLPSWFGY